MTEPSTPSVLSPAELAHRHTLWKQFRERWPVSALRAMTLEQYTNLEKDDSFTYWVEARLSDLGSIWGLNSFKFGIYRRATGDVKESGSRRTYTDEYAWRTRHGTTLAEAFASVRDMVVAVAEHAAAGDFEAIDEIDLMSLYKWKLALLYQDPSAGTVFPIFQSKTLLELYRAHVDPTARPSVPISVRYSSLRARFADVDIIELGFRLWAEHEAATRADQPRERQTWAVNLDLALPRAEVTALLRPRAIGNERVPAALRDWIDAQEDLAKDDRLALVSEGRVRARARFLTADDDDISWSQEGCDIAWTGPDLAPGLARVPDRVASAIWGESARAVVATAPVDPIATRNIVLYGPPGTGKTFATTRHALQLVLGADVVASLSQEAATKELRRLQQEGRVEMVTFHQAYGYEEFVEGLRPALDDAGTGEVRYELHPGVFKRIALRAAAAGMRTQAEDPPFDVLWTELLRRVRADEDRILSSASGNEYVLVATSHDNFASRRTDRNADGEIVQQVASRSIAELWWKHQAELGPPDALSYEKTGDLIRRERGGGGGHHYTALWLVYRELLALRDELRNKRETAAPDPAQVQAALDRAVPGKVDFAFTSKTPQFVLVIDEINRGNVSKVLGELITLLEPDKRLGAPNELKLPLAYSPDHRFAVPPNLHIVATMNTADRSIALMDVALRRRFEFVEVMPDPDALRKVLLARTRDPALTDLAVGLLDTMNARIRFLYDRDHQIGHAYFMSVTDLASLARVMVDRIVPLLQEYFYGRWDRVCAVLGCPHDEDGRPLRRGPVVEGARYRAPIVEVVTASPRSVLGYDSEEHEGRTEHRVAPALLARATPARELVPYLLGVLDLGADALAAREKLLVRAIAEP